MAEKSVWLDITKQLNDKSGTSSSSSSDKFSPDDHGGARLISVQTSEGETMKQLSAKVLQVLGLSETGFVLQLRNKRKSLIPLNGKLEENTKRTPYRLTVLKEYQRVMPKPKSIQMDSYSSTIHNHTRMFLSRISNLENSIPELNVKREEKIKQEIGELEDKLNFLQKRFNEADKMEWTGIIKKSPLW